MAVGAAGSPELAERVARATALEMRALGVNVNYAPVCDLATNPNNPALGIRSFAPSVTACPGCGRTTSTTFQELAERTQDYIREQMPAWKKTYEGIETLTLAVMGPSR